MLWHSVPINSFLFPTFHRDLEALRVGCLHNLNNKLHISSSGHRILSRLQLHAYAPAPKKIIISNKKIYIRTNLSWLNRWLCKNNRSLYQMLLFHLLCLYHKFWAAFAKRKINYFIPLLRKNHTNSVSYFLQLHVI